MKKRFCLLMFVCLALINDAQENYKIKVNTLLLSKLELISDLSFYQMKQSDVEPLKQRLRSSSTYSIASLEYYEEKQLLKVFVRSSGVTSVNDFANWLQELRILKLVYNSERIATADLPSKYKPQTIPVEVYTPSRLKK